MKVWCFVVAAALATTATLADNPGLRLRLTDKFLEALKSTGKKLATGNEINLPGLPNAEMPGGVELVTFKISDLDLSNADISFASPNQIQLTSSAGRVTLEGILRRREDGENVTATWTVGVIDIDVALAFGRSANKHPSLAQTRCSISVGGTDLEFGGTSDSQVELVAKHSAVKLKQMATTLLCPQMEMVLRMASTHMQRMPTSLPIFRGLAVDMALSNDPVATDDYLQFDFSGRTHKAGVVGKADKGSEYNPTAFDSAVDNSRMFYVWFSEEMANRFLREYHTNGLAQYTLDKGGKRAWYEQAKERLQTLATSLGKEIKDNEDVEITVRTAEAPSVIMESGKPEIVMKLKLEITVKVRPGADDETMIRGVLATQGSVSIKWNKTLANEAYPSFEEKYEITEFTIESLEGIDLSEDQKTALTESLESEAQQFIAKKLLKMRSKGTLQIRQMVVNHVYNKLQNFDLKVNNGNMEIAFDLELNADAELGGGYGGRHGRSQGGHRHAHNTENLL